jgi:catechol 2,3-dioxygenase-like lactoylglutathione lyase family enzyme
VTALHFDHCVIAVSDWERSNSFYRDVLGADVIEIRAGRFAYRFGDHQLSVHGPGVDVGDNVALKPVEPGNSDLCFVWPGRVEDAVEHLRQRGVNVETGPVQRVGARGEGTSVYFRDPDGSLPRVHLVRVALRAGAELDEVRRRVDVEEQPGVGVDDARLEFRKRVAKRQPAARDASLEHGQRRTPVGAR